jgi:CRP/FNR family transcriptional regulator, cyclic AMP receptor protein
MYDFSPQQAERASALLTANRACLGLAQSDALTVVAHMSRQVFVDGMVLIRENERGDSSAHMMLVMRGAVVVEQQCHGRGDPLIIARLEEGDFIGEMSIIDGAPRSATCRADGDLEVATLSREQLLRLVAKHPAIAAKLLLAVAQRMAERLRQTAQKLFLYEQLVSAANDQLIE